MSQFFNILNYVIGFVILAFCLYDGPQSVGFEAMAYGGLFILVFDDMLKSVKSKPNPNPLIK
jgi:hypothetical protein